MHVEHVKRLAPADRENLAIGVFNDKASRKAAAKAHAWASRFLALPDFKAKAGECVVLYPGPGPSDGGVTRGFVTGLGKRSEWSPFRALEAVASATRRAGALGVKRLAFALPAGAARDPACLEGAAQGAVLGAWRYDRFKEPKPDTAAPVAEVALTTEEGGAGLRKSCESGRVVAECQAFVRDLASLPANLKTPSHVADAARAMARKAGLRSEVLGPKEMRALGMEAILGVARGSAEPPAFVILEYKPRSAGSKPPVVLVGKGITFDSGGISLKPAENMHHMKDDMTGGAIVLAALRACAELKLPVHVVGLAPFSENMPGGRAQKPGDIVRAMNGKTIEVLNTDAEGRLVLADALAYAERYKPAALVDLATLTGAASVALGRFAIGAMGTDQRLIDRLKAAGEATGERVWQLPLWDDHLELMRGEAADLKNTGGREAGTITAAAFLREFARHSPWCHLDIAAGAWASDEKPWRPKGPTGNGLRLVVQFLRSWKG